MTFAPLDFLRRFEAALPEPLYRPLAALRRLLRKLRGRHHWIEVFEGDGRASNRCIAVVAGARSTTVDYLMNGLLDGARLRGATRLATRRRWLTALAEPPAAPIELVRATDGSTLPVRFEKCWQIPEGVQSLVCLEGARDGGKRRRFGDASHHQRIARYGLTARVSHDFRDFDRFYDQAYLVHVRSRFGALARPHSRTELRRSFRRGGLLWVQRAGVDKAGMLFTIDSETAKIHVSAPLEGDAARIGALAAARKFVFDLAIEHGCATVDMGVSRPNLLDGVLVHKKHWGARLVAAPGFDTHIHVRWDRFDTDIGAWLAAMPLVVRDGSGLSALTAVPAEAGAEDVQRHLRRLAAPGLQRIFVVNDASTAFAIDTVDGFDVVWLDAAGSGWARRCGAGS